MHNYGLTKSFRLFRIAFAELYNRYWKPLIDMAGKRNLPLEVAEEIVQDIFTDFYTRRKELQIGSSVEATVLSCIKQDKWNTIPASWR